ncbi:uncharacterized protein LOC135500443 [Lineus longissimus]|uniref:uncharacterized protein LOC135500443 n=1 Tax=Lineus longissimus TaxID=88925 RepID=UPI002B4C5020
MANQPVCDRWYIVTAAVFISVCSFVGVVSNCPTESDAKRCLGDVGMSLNDLRMRRLFGSNNSSVIEPICSSANIPGAMECMKVAIRYCRQEVESPHLRLIHLEGYKKAMIYTCHNIDIYREKVEPCILDPRSGIERVKCWKTQAKQAKAHLELNKATSDSRAILCTDHRLIEYCTDVAYRKACGGQSADYLRHVAILTEPSSCDRATDRGYCPPPLPPHPLIEGKTTTKRTPSEEDDKTVYGGSSEAKMDGIRMFIIILFLLLSLL